MGPVGFTQERFSNYGNNRFLQAEKLPESLVIKEENYIQITLSPTSCLNLDKFHVGTCVSDCRSASFATVDLIIRITYVSQRTPFKLMIDFELECFQA